MKLNKYSICLVFMLIILILTVTAFAQDGMIHEAHYYMDGIIDFRQQVGDEQGTGALRRQTIDGEGEMDKTLGTVQVAGKTTVEDVQDWTTSVDAMQNLTVTSAIELCAPGMQEFTTTKYEMVADDEIFVPEGMFLLEGHINPTQVSRVIPLYRDGYDQSIETEFNEEENRFEFAAPMFREPGALIFIKEDDEGNESFLGHLSLSGDLGYIPGNYLDDGVTSIDVGNITFDGSTGNPAYNPLDGEEINIADNDLDAAAVAGSFFSAIAMSKDLVEAAALDNVFISIENHYHTSTFVLNDPDEDIVRVDTNNGNFAIDSHKINVGITGSDYGSLSLQYPDNGLKVNEEVRVDGRVFFPAVGSEKENGNNEPRIPPAGDYTLSDDEDLIVSFSLPSIVDQAQNHLVIPRPEIHLVESESEKYIDEIRWEFITPDGEPITEPGKILDQVEIQIEDSDREQFYASGWLPIGLDNLYQPEEEIKWDDVAFISMVYDDIYGLHYVVPFDARPR